jgi:hypothetical protein
MKHRTVDYDVQEVQPVLAPFHPLQLAVVPYDFRSGPF